MIESTNSLIHWNYFIALEKDLEVVTRYIELVEPNFKTFSIELAKLLSAASSEVDVVMRDFCKLYDKKINRNSNINDYCAVIKKKAPDLIQENVFVKRYGLTLKPWSSWKEDSSPLWWCGYNKVKHERNLHFSEANLNNVLNSMAALLIVVVYYYQKQLSKGKDYIVEFRDLTNILLPRSTLLNLNKNYYYDNLVI